MKNYKSILENMILEFFGIYNSLEIYCSRGNVTWCLFRWTKRAPITHCKCLIKLFDIEQLNCKMEMLYNCGWDNFLIKSKKYILGTSFYKCFVCFILLLLFKQQRLAKPSKIYFKINSIGKKMQMKLSNMEGVKVGTLWNEVGQNDKANRDKFQTGQR